MNFNVTHNGSSSYIVYVFRTNTDSNVTQSDPLTEMRNQFKILSERFFERQRFKRH